MRRGLYLLAADGCQETVWRCAVRSLSARGDGWLVDCLDCLYETGLSPGMYTTDSLLAALKGSRDIFSARMICLPEARPPDREIKTCDDFFAGNAHGIILCADGVHFEVFSRQEERLSNLMRSLPGDSIVRAAWLEESLGGRRELVV